MIGRLVNSVEILIWTNDGDLPIARRITTIDEFVEVGRLLRRDSLDLIRTKMGLPLTYLSIDSNSLNNL